MAEPTFATGTPVDPSERRRNPGQRGQKTRRRLLDSVQCLIQSTAYRDLRVVDVAALAETSPATFYQYFDDLNQVLHILAAEMVERESAALVSVIGAGDWSDDGVAAAASDFVDTVIAVWERNRAMLGLIDLGVAHGDPKSVAARNALVVPALQALSDALGERDTTMSPQALSGVLIAMLTSVATHVNGLHAWGASRDELRKTMVGIVAGTALRG